MTAPIDNIIGGLKVPSNSEVIFSGSATSINIPLEAGTYYIKLAATVPDYWQVIEVNPSIFNESNVTIRSGCSGRTATQFLAIYYAEATKINSTTLRIRALFNALNFGTASGGTRPITRILKAK